MSSEGRCGADTETLLLGVQITREKVSAQNVSEVPVIKAEKVNTTSKD